VHLQACLCLVGLWVAGVLWFLAGIFKKRNAAAANVVLPGSGTKETPSQRAGARLKPEPLAAGDLDLAAVVIALEAAAKAIETAMDTMMVAAQQAAARTVAV